MYVNVYVTEAHTRTAQIFLWRNIFHVNCLKNKTSNVLRKFYIPRNTAELLFAWGQSFNCRYSLFAKLFLWFESFIIFSCVAKLDWLIGVKLPLRLRQFIRKHLKISFSVIKHLRRKIMMRNSKSLNKQNSNVIFGFLIVLKSGDFYCTEYIINYLQY